MLEVYYDVKKGKQSYEDIIQQLREYYNQRKRSVKVDHKTNSTEQIGKKENQCIGMQSG